MRPPFIAITLLSAAALGCEILLIRLLSIIQWHHFAYMVISLSMLGYGASGMFLTLAREKILPCFTVAFMINAVLFAFSSVACFLVVRHIPFNPLELAWGLHQLAFLFLLYLVLTLPFFAAANCIGLCLMRFADNISRIYACDLTGAGLGALGIVILLCLLPPMTALYCIGSLALFAAGIAFLEWSLRPRWAAALLPAAALLFPLVLHQLHIPLPISPYKSLSQTLTVTGTEVVEERNSPLGLLTVVRSPLVPFRYAPGLSLNCTTVPPPQLAVFTDGEGMNVITASDGRYESLTYLDYVTSALPYHLLSRPTVLVLGAGGGSDVLQALHHKAEHVDAVELNPQIADLVTTYADFAGNLYTHKNVTLHIAEGRGFAAASSLQYDLIQVALLDAFSASSAGLYALTESYIYTVEALTEYIEHLQPGGMLAITRWIKLPPRDGLKLFATAIAALERMGVTDPSSHLILIRSWKTSTLLVKNSVLTKEDIHTLKRFCRERSFDMAYYPGMDPEEANCYNILDKGYFFQGANALLNRAESRDFIKNYKFNLAPATDDRPYFFHFFKWASFAELLALRAKGGLPLLEQGYLVIIITFIQAVLAGVLLILLPLWLADRARSKALSSPLACERFWVVSYFFSLGIAFLFIEMAFIQKFILFLHHPLYAVGVVISGFLLFAGFGSLSCSRLKQEKNSSKCVLGWAVCGITVISIAYLGMLPILFRHLLHLGDPLKILVSLCLIAPLAFCMGMPFPLGLARLSSHAPGLVPWAWGINGCASVISAVLATLLATHMGFSGVVVVAICFYVLAAVVFPQK